MEQNEAKSNKTDLNGLKLIEMDRNTTNWNRPQRNKWTETDQNRPIWTDMDRNGQKKTKTDWSHITQ